MSPAALVLRSPRVTAGKALGVPVPGQVLIGVVCDVLIGVAVLAWFPVGLPVPARRRNVEM